MGDWESYRVEWKRERNKEREMEITRYRGNMISQIKLSNEDYHRLYTFDIIWVRNDTTPDIQCLDQFAIFLQSNATLATMSTKEMSVFNSKDGFLGTSWHISGYYNHRSLTLTPFSSFPALLQRPSFEDTNKDSSLHPTTTTCLSVRR